MFYLNNNKNPKPTNQPLNKPHKINKQNQKKQQKNKNNNKKKPNQTKTCKAKIPERPGRCLRKVFCSGETKISFSTFIVFQKSAPSAYRVVYKR